MISKSDLFILVLASGALAVGIFRWHQNTQDVNAITIPASASSTANNTVNNTVVVEPAQNSNLPVFKTAEVKTVEVKTADVANTPVNTSIQTDADGQIVVKTLAQPEPVAGIVVEAETTNAANLGTHVVESGDYLGKIADQYGTDVQTLRKLNNISGSIIQIGQEILYPR